MKLFRKVVAWCVATLAVVLVCAAIVVASPWGHGIDLTVQHAREIEKSFSEASAFVDGFAHSNGRLPTDTEFSSWAAAQPDRAYSARDIRLIIALSQIPHEVTDRFGKPTGASYVLQYWRGEWFEYYASWVSASTLELDPRSFFLFGSAIADGVALLAIGLLFGVIAKVAWPPPNPAVHPESAPAALHR